MKADWLFCLRTPGTARPVVCCRLGSSSRRHDRPRCRLPRVIMYSGSDDTRGPGLPGRVALIDWRQKQMDIHKFRQLIAERDSISILETVDVHTKVRSVLEEFDYVIEAPNWTQDGRYLVYNSRGHLYTYELATGEIRQIDTGFAIDCNNDHVL